MSGKKSRSLGCKFLIIFSILGIFIGASFIYVCSQVYNNQINLRYISKAEELVQAAAEIVDWDNIDDYVATLEETEQYEETLENLGLINRGASSAYLFVLVPFEGKSMYIYDTHIADKRVNLGQIVDWYPEFQDQVDQLNAGEAITPIYLDNEFGRFLRVYTPFYNSQNEFAGYLGVDYYVNAIIAEKALFMEKITLGVLLLIAGISTIFLSVIHHLILAPIGKISNAASGYLVSSGDDFATSNSIRKLDIKTGDELQQLSDSIKNMEQRLQEYINSLEHATVRAETDSMTRLLNRESFKNKVAETLHRDLDSKYISVFMMVDLDNFKIINDSKGHLAGDEVISLCAEAIRSKFRSTDLVARMGGDEFAVFYSSVDSDEDVQRRSEAVCNAIAQLDIDTDIKITASVGVAIARNTNNSYRKLYMEADTALYEAKAKGRNCFSIRKI